MIMVSHKIHCTVGWVNLYQKLGIEKNTICGKVAFSQKKDEYIFLHKQLANMHGLPNICKLHVAKLLKIGKLKFAKEYFN